MCSKTKEIQNYVEKIVNEPFVSRLTKKDFEIFLTPQDYNDCITKSIYDDENNTVKIYLKNHPERIMIFHDFYIQFKTNKNVEISKGLIELENHRWEVFMEHKFGKEYTKKHATNTNHYNTENKNLHQTKLESFGL